MYTNKHIIKHSIVCMGKGLYAVSHVYAKFVFCVGEGKESIRFKVVSLPSAALTTSVFNISMT
jgi:hypothetical protein